MKKGLYGKFLLSLIPVIFGIAFAIIFLDMGNNVNIPGTYISSYGGYTEYVGGDAYNFIIEAGLRGGRIAGGRAERAIYFAVSAVLGFFSLLQLFRSINKLGDDLRQLKREVQQAQKAESILGSNDQATVDQQLNAAEPQAEQTQEDKEENPYFAANKQNGMTDGEREN